MDAKDKGDEIMTNDLMWTQQNASHSETLGEITKAMAKVQGAVGIVAKSGENKFDRYKYATEPDLIFAVQGLMAKNGLALFTSTYDYELMDRVTSKGKKENAAIVKMSGLLTHVSGEWVRVESIGEGQDRSDKSVYKAMTGAKKYLLGKLFNLPTGDEPEADSGRGSFRVGSADPTFDRAKLNKQFHAALRDLNKAGDNITKEMLKEAWGIDSIKDMTDLQMSQACAQLQKRKIEARSNGG